jgi:TatD DNase family protein
MIDSHAHYDNEMFDPDREEIIEKAIEAGVTHIINAGCDIKSSQFSIELAEKFPQIYAAVGVHPHEASTCDGTTIDTLKSLAGHRKVKAIGEIGLDYHYDFSPREVQKQWFASQLRLAQSLKLPVIIHNRESHRDVLDIVKAERMNGLTGVFHCFSGSVEMARELLNLGFYIGIGGAVTFKKAQKPVEVVQYCPLDRLLIETDCPYMTPEPHRGKRNWSGYLVHVIDRIALIKGIKPVEVISATTRNAMDLFCLDV